MMKVELLITMLHRLVPIDGSVLNPLSFKARRSRKRYSRLVWSKYTHPRSAPGARPFLSWMVVEMGLKLTR